MKDIRTMWKVSMKQVNVALLFIIVLASCAGLEDTTQTPLPTLTITQSKTSEPGQKPTELPTSTLLPSKTDTPPPTSTLTLIPPDSILFQNDFEGGRMGEFDQIDSGGIWAIEQEPDGNHYLCGSGPSINPPQIWYRDRRTVWTDYAFETRVKFVIGNTLFIIFRSDLASNQHYGVALSGKNLSLMRTWSEIDGASRRLPDLDHDYIFRVYVKGSSLSIYLENSLVEDVSLEPPVITYGGIGYVSGPAVKVCLDDIKVWSLK